MTEKYNLVYEDSENKIKGSWSGIPTDCDPFLITRAKLEGSEEVDSEIAAERTVEELIADGVCEAKQYTNEQLGLFADWLKDVDEQVQELAVKPDNYCGAELEATESGDINLKFSNVKYDEENETLVTE